MKILANENFPRDAVESMRQLGHDVVWIRTASPGIDDRAVLQRAVIEKRILVTFDKDFGELAFRHGLPAACGVILFRVTSSSSVEMTRKIITALASQSNWAGHFSVVDDHKIRLRKLT